jgi:putative endonuclease
VYFDETSQERNPDTMTLRNNCVHFVEVKTRTGMDYGTPGAAVTYTKQQKLRKTALIWLQEQEQYYSGLCFDVIEVWVTGKTAKIRWLQCCF